MTTLQRTAMQEVCSSWPSLLPPNRMRVSDGAKNLIIKRPGGSGGPWSAAETPYMVEPVDMLGSRAHSAVCFVGPAQTGKTVGLGEGWLAHAVVNDPGDMLIVQMTQDKAREYSKQRIDRAVKNSPKLREMRSAMSRDDNLHDKQFRNGMWLRIAWPTATNLSSTSYRYVFGTDYDRWPHNIDGEGDGFTLMGKRVTTFLSRGMVAVESSPGYPIVDPTWKPTTPHEAPPVGTAETGGGVLSIFNRGDRRRWQWQCADCAEHFEATPGLGLFRLHSDNELLEDIRSLDIDAYARQHARVICPHCGSLIPWSQRERMNAAGIWLPEGVQIDARRRLSGDPRRSTIASFWLGGVAATYTTWHSLIAKHLQALLDYEMTGNELPLQTTANTDQGVPYMSRHLAEAAAASKGNRVVADLAQYIVPDWARFLVAAVDVQGGQNARFVVQVHAIGEHQEQQVIDRFAITRSKRQGMGEDFAPLDPAGHAEDWDLLDDLLLSTYRTSDPDRELRVKVVGVDTNGEDGVTGNAYAWARRVRTRGLSARLKLLKGASTKADWFVRETQVGGVQGNGDLTLHLLEPNKLKDLVAAGLARHEPGPGFYHFPAPRSEHNPNGWLLPSFFDELRAEVRNESGVWEKVKKRNETFDLCYMIRGLCVILGADKRTFWEHPPAWALPVLEGNTDVMTPEQRRAAKEAAAARRVEGYKKPQPIERRVRRSNYLQ
jgi:phage terminase large subunit GpA-like protein